MCIKNKSKYPDIIIIVLDAVRSRNLSCYGYERKTSPHLDNFAKKNVIYHNAISTSSWTLPSVSSIFTGLYPSEHGIFGINTKLKKQETIAHKLKSYGYETIAFSNVGWVTEYLGLNKGFDTFIEIDRYTLPKKKIPRYIELLKSTLSLRDYGAEIANAKIGDWFQKRKKDKPYFMYVHYVEPHFPYNPPRPYHSTFGNIYPWTLFINKNIKKNEFPDFYSGQWSISKKEWDIILNLYDNEIFYLDKKIGELLSLLQNDDNNQLIFITADHGECLSDQRALPVLQHQFGLYDDLIKVPLLVKYPENRRRVIENQVQLTDIFGTINEIIDTKKVKNNRSLLQKEDDFKKSQYAISEFIPHKLILDRIDNPTVNNIYKQRRKAIRTNTQKYIECKDLKEYFDLQNDPLEFNNLYNDFSEFEKEKLRQNMNTIFNNMLVNINKNKQLFKQIGRNTLSGKNKETFEDCIDKSLDQ